MLGATIRAWRKHRGLSVTELAARAGFGEQGRAYISKLEHGDITRPTPENLNRVAQALDVNPADLVRHQTPPRDGLDRRQAAPVPPELAASNGTQQTAPAAPHRRGMRYGSGFPVAPPTRADMLRDILRQAEAIKQSVEALLAQED
jgi:transcriptional regulator with XRE-family HTH domain